MANAAFTVADYLGLAFYAGAWLAYYLMVERSEAGRRTLNRVMNAHRYEWMRGLTGRDNRIIDANINASLQNGTAFFASTSLLAIGGSLTLLRSTDEVLTLFAEMPLGFATTRLAWEVKVIGLTVLFVYAFFKFAWSYRLFNYSAILIGAVPNPGSPAEAIELAAWRAASMNTVAGRHFNRGQRAFFFALAYLGWFLSPYVLMASTAAVLVVMCRRQFASDALAALSRGPCAAAAAVRRGEMKVAPERIEETILALVAERGPGKTICPSEAARAIAGDHPDSWGPMMGAVRQVAVRLMKAGRIVIRRKGRPVDPDEFRGVYRISGPESSGP